MENLKFASILEKGNLTPLRGELKEEYRRIIIALKEAWDFSGLTIQNLKIVFNDETLIFKEENMDKILILFGKGEIDVESVEKELMEKVKEQKFTAKEVPEKAPEKKEVEIIEKPLKEEIFDNAFEITVKHLSLFGEMVFENILKEMKIDKKNCTPRVFKRFLKKLEESAQMIVGPSKAKEMSKEIESLLK
ncbi:MAG: hypothetical protein ABIM58_03010 [candidate division WOR-3 bacterium]